MLLKFRPWIWWIEKCHLCNISRYILFGLGHQTHLQPVKIFKLSSRYQLPIYIDKLQNDFESGGNEQALILKAVSTRTRYFKKKSISRVRNVGHGIRWNLISDVANRGAFYFTNWNQVNNEEEEKNEYIPGFSSTLNRYHYSWHRDDEFYIILVTIYFCETFRTTTKDWYYTSQKSILFFVVKKKMSIHKKCANVLT